MVITWVSPLLIDLISANRYTRNMKCRLLVVGFFSLLFSASIAHGYDGVDLYDCVISKKDRFNSSGTKLTSVRDILAQDRANYHRFDRRDAGDRYDNYFTSVARRATWQRVKLEISPILAQKIKNGGKVEIKVFIFEDFIRIKPGLFEVFPPV